jgi:hypothetical protein
MSDRSHQACVENAPKNYKDLPHESPLKQAWLKTISEAEVILS